MKARIFGILQALLSLTAIVLAGVALRSHQASSQKSQPLGVIGYSSWSVTDWYVDPQNVTGLASDGNSCQSSSLPCLTWTQIAHWYGTTRPALGGSSSSPSFTATVHILSAWSDSTADAIDIDPVSGFLEFIGPIGSVNQIASGTLSGVLAKNPTTGQVLTATLTAGLATGELIHNTTHDSYAWVSINVSGNTYLISQPLGHPASTEVDTWTNGDAFIVYKPVNMVVNYIGPNVYFDFVSIGEGVNVGNDRIAASFYAESQVAYGPLGEPENVLAATATNCDLPNTMVWTGGSLAVVGGQWRGGNNMQGNMQLSEDFLSVGLLVIPRESSTLDKVWLANTSNMLVGTGSVSMGGYIAGTGLIQIEPDTVLNYAPALTTASNVFLSTASIPLQFNHYNSISTGCALDKTSDPAVIHCGRNLTAALLDTSVTSGGFGGNAFLPGGGSIVNF